MNEEIKLAIINDQSGEINYFYIGETDYFHSVLLSGYIKENYMFDKDLDGLDLGDANSMSLFLREHGNIVFLNDTTYKNSKPDIHGKTGIVIFPDNITDEQVESLMQLNNQLESYDGLQIWYDFESHAECKMIFTKNKEQVTTILPYLIEEHFQTKKTK